MLMLIRKIISSYKLNTAQMYHSIKIKSGFHGSLFIYIKKGISCNRLIMNNFRTNNNLFAFSENLHGLILFSSYNLLA